MKKIFALLLTLTMVLTIAPFALAEESEAESESQFERVLLQKGSLLIKEFIDVVDIGSQYMPALFQAATLTDAESGSKYYALRIEAEYYNSQYDTGTVVGVLDSAEIDGAITTLQYLKDHLKGSKDYTEIVYTASSGLVIGGYHSSNTDNIFFQFNSRTSRSFSFDKIDTIIEALQKVKDSFGK